jgi:hypothetical protein
MPLVRGRGEHESRNSSADAPSMARVSMARRRRSGPPASHIWMSRGSVFRVHACESARQRRNADESPSARASRASQPRRARRGTGMRDYTAGIGALVDCNLSATLLPVPDSDGDWSLARQGASRVVDPFEPRASRAAVPPREICARGARCSFAPRARHGACSVRDRRGNDGTSRSRRDPVGRVGLAGHA